MRQKSTINKGLTKRTLCGIILLIWIHSFLVIFLQIPSIDSTCFLHMWGLWGIIFFSLVQILRIPTYLGIKGDQFFSDLAMFFCWLFYVQIGVLQFVSRVRFVRKIECNEFVCNKFVSNLVKIDLIQFEYTNCIRSICTKTNTNLLHTNLLHSILCTNRTRNKIVVHQFVHKTSAKKNS